MKKIFLTVMAAMLVNVTFAQIDASGKPSAECLKVAAFNRKFASVKQADKIFMGYLIHIRGKRPVRQVNFAAANANLKNFDVYKWLIADTATTGAGSSEVGSPDALPTDRLFMEVEYVIGGQVRTLTENFRFCQNEDPYKAPKPTLKLADKPGDGKKCFKITDFKSRLQELPEDDTINVSYTLFNTAGEKALISFKTWKELKQFNLYNWLTKGAEVTSVYGANGVITPTSEGKKVIAQPGDLVIVNLSHIKNGQERNETNQFPICSTPAKK